jgi:2-iminobutanoate/2-iminopropanoate deaminase
LEENNMKDVFTEKAPQAIGPYTQAKVVGELVFTSGQIALNPATGALAEGGIEAQTKQVCENLKAVLEAAGSSLDKAVKTTCFLNDIGDFAAFNKVYGEYFTGKPARSCVGGLNLPKGALVEVEVVASL